MATPQYRQESQVTVLVGQVSLPGDLVIPAEAIGIVLFAHGSGSSRTSPRNRFVADMLQQAGLATLLIDLLTAEEEAVDLRTARLRFDIQLLAERLIGAVDWLRHQPVTQQLPIGLFGASTGAAAALVAAAERPELVKAIVSRGGRPDLAGSALNRVQSPTLLIVGGHDYPVIEMNQAALTQTPAEKQLEIIPEATHLFEERGTLDQVARLASRWFQHYLALNAQHLFVRQE
jgi:putative phosphoribosyl transferase